MTISSTVSKAGPFSCNGVQTAFPFTFKVFTKSDVRVVLTTSAGVESDLVLDSTYTVTLNGDQDANPGGTVNTSSAYATGFLLTLVSDQEANQGLDLTNYRPEVIEKALDKLTLLVQQAEEKIARSLKTGVSSSVTADALLELISASASQAQASATAAGTSATEADTSAAEAAASAAEYTAYPRGVKNRITNSRCRVAQYGAVAAVNGSWVYGGCDRIACLLSGTTASGTIAQQSSTGFKSNFAQGVTATLTGSGVVRFQQRVESANVIDLNSQTVTAFAWVYQNTGGTINAQMGIGKPTSTADTFSAQSAVAAGASTPIPNATWTLISATVALGAASASLGLTADVTFSAGAVTSKLFAVTEMGLVQGPGVPSALDIVSLAKDFDECTNYATTFSFGTLVFSVVGGSGYQIALPLTRRMRAVPVITGFSAATQANITGTVVLSAFTPYMLQLGGGSGTTTGMATLTQGGVALLNAEL